MSITSEQKAFCQLPARDNRLQEDAFRVLDKRNHIDIVIQFQNIQFLVSELAFAWSDGNHATGFNLQNDSLEGYTPLLDQFLILFLVPLKNFCHRKNLLKCVPFVNT